MSKLIDELGRKENADTHKKIFLILSILSFVLTFCLMFCPFFEYAKITVHEAFDYETVYVSCRPIDYLLNLDHSRDLVNGVQTAEAILFLLVLVITICMLVRLLGAIISYSKYDTFILRAKKMISRCFIYSIIYIAMSILIVGIVIATDNSDVIRNAGAYLQFIFALIIYLSLGFMKKVVVKATENKNYFYVNRNWKVIFLVALWTTIILELILLIMYVSIASYHASNLIYSILAVLFAGLFVCIKTYKLSKIQESLLKVYEDKKEADKKFEKELISLYQGKSKYEEKIKTNNVTGYRALSERMNWGKSLEYGSYSSITELVDEFIDFAKCNGLDVEKQDVLNVFSAMMASRAVWLNGASEEYLKTLVTVLKEFFDCASEIYEIPNDTNEEHDVLCSEVDENGKNLSSISGICGATESKNNVGIVAFSNVKYQDFEKLFPSFENYFKAPEFGDEIYVGYIKGINDEKSVVNGYLKFTPNLWCFFISNQPIKEMNVKISQYSWGVTVKERPLLTPVQSDKEFKTISYRDFMDLSNNMLENNFIPLDIWSKFDKVEEYFASISNFSISNPIWHQIEKFSSSLVAFGFEAINAIDMILAFKVLPYFTNFVVNKKSETSLSECIDNVFGMENLPLTHKALTDLGLDR